ncbi:unnamed protein product [Closterium sp. Naga37s-1]|nr:unnamed protein product [Closterium sp. Naga37s-1]
MTAQYADDEDMYDMTFLAEDDCDTDSDDEVEYSDEDEEEEGAWECVILDLAAALTGPEGKEWWAAMKGGMGSFDEQGTWTLRTIPLTVPMPCKQRTSQTHQIGNMLGKATLSSPRMPCMHPSSVAVRVAVVFSGLVFVVFSLP